MARDFRADRNRFSTSVAMLGHGLRIHDAVERRLVAVAGAETCRDALVGLRNGEQDGPLCAAQAARRERRVLEPGHAPPCLFARPCRCNARTAAPQSRRAAAAISISLKLTKPSRLEHDLVAYGVHRRGNAGSNRCACWS